MPIFKPIHSNDDGLRGRLRTTKCLFSKSAPARTYMTSYEEPNKRLEAFEKEWFAGNLSMDSIYEMGTTVRCSCGTRTNLAALQPRRAPTELKSTSYPPYLLVGDGEAILVKGSTSQLIMRLLEDGIPVAKIARKLAKKLPTERYSTGEVQSIIRTCALLGLNGQSPFATASWENEAIEGWWLKEDSYCEALRREQPVNEEVCGYNCEDGWWTGKQCAKHRDWERWPCRSIGPENWRRERYRLYELYGAKGIVLGGND
ncbi:hypothetical protein H2200_010666 [Cladophialophora chaetospira]|uniref:Uncharacterized protein n=1 Tax=Cladophialophora chaetospira TaxID=386627 RepID=A0AA39CDR3_9EURO|nr:hypothetical protein H2200_010666 [Cladophialophora chaetospira]